jgi:hypothetical protein
MMHRAERREAVVARPFAMENPGNRVPARLLRRCVLAACAGGGDRAK